MRIYLTDRITVEAGGRTLTENDLAGGQGRLVFAHLAAEHDKPVPAEALGALLWGDALPKVWEKALAAVVSKLRSSLGRVGLAGRDVITNAFGCYQLALPEGGWIDTDAASEHLDEAEAALADGDGERAVAAATVAAALSRRSFLPGSEAEWVTGMRASRKDLLVRALDALAAGHVLAGVPAAGVAPAEEAVVLEPFREGAWVRLMTTLAAAGDRAEALRAYERCRALLVDELGIDPSPQTQEVYLELLREDAATGPGAAPTAHSIPIPRTPFVGRTTDLAVIAEHLAEPGVVTLAGPGGSGKTRLACETALRLLSRFPGGAWFADLAPLRDADVVPIAVADAVAVTIEGGEGAARAIAARLGPDTILILDNCEHVIDAVRTLLTEVVAAAPQGRIIATSRQALGLPRERAVVVAPLPLPDMAEADPARAVESPAVRLFCDRAAYARPDFALTPENAPAVVRICRRLDGLPLALELAAARVRVLSAEQIDERLDDRFRLLRRSADAAPDRQQSLEAAIAWSVELLTEAQRILLARMTLFPGGCTLEAVEEVCTGGPVDRADVLDLVQELADRNLVAATAEGERVRYRMLESIRAYVSNVLTDADATAYGERQIAWLRAAAASAAPKLLADGQGVWLERLEAEHDNFREAFDRMSPLDALHTVVHLERFWVLRGHWFEGRHRYAATLAAAGNAAPPELRARALAASAYLACQQGDIDAARALSSQAVEIARSCGAAKELAAALLQRANAEYLDAQLDAATELYLEALERCREVGDLRGVGIAAGNLGLVAHDRGDLAAAEQHYAEGIAIDRELGDADAVALGISNLASVAYDRQDFTASLSLYEESLAIQREIGSRATVGTLHGLARLAIEMRHLDDAAARIEECRAAAREVGHRPAEIACIELSGQLALRRGDLIEASARYEESIRGYDEIDARPQLATTLRDAAEVEVARGRHDAARALLERAASLSAEIGATHVEAEARESLAALPDGS